MAKDLSVAAALQDSIKNGTKSSRERKEDKKRKSSQLSERLSERTSVKPMKGSEVMKSTNDISGISGLLSPGIHQRQRSVSKDCLRESTIKDLDLL